MRPRPVAARPRARLRDDLAEGLAFVRREPWLWGSLLMAGFSLLVFWGPFEVLLPFVIKNELGGSATDFGLLLAAGGVGGISASVYLSRRGLPETSGRRHLPGSTRYQPRVTMAFLSSMPSEAITV